MLAHPNFGASIAGTILTFKQILLLFRVDFEIQSCSDDMFVLILSEELHTFFAWRNLLFQLAVLYCTLKMSKERREHVLYGGNLWDVDNG